MRLSIPGRLLSAVLMAAVLLGGCNDDDPAGPGVPPAGVVPDFALTDANPTSGTYDQAVSPRDYLQQVSAWYFGHAT